MRDAAQERGFGVTDQTTALRLLPPFTYSDLVQLEADQHRLKVHNMQQLLRRLAAVFDYVDDVTLPMPVIGEVVDLIAASPILLAGLLGALEQLGRRNARGAFVEVVGSLVEAGVTAIPLVEALDVVTGPIRRKRTATMAREFVEGLIAGDRPRQGWWTTTREQEAYYIEPDGDGFIASYYGNADVVSRTPLLRVRYDKNEQQSVWTPQSNQWSPVSAHAGQPTAKLP